MPNHDDNWFDELADASSSNDPLINAVRHAADRIDPSCDDLALARLKKRLRGEGLLESRAQRFIRQYSPPLASAAVVLLCFSVLLQSGLISQSGEQTSLQYSLEPSADYSPAGPEVEYFDQANQGSEEALAPSAELYKEEFFAAAPTPQAAPAKPAALSRDSDRADKEVALGEALRLQEQRSKRAAESAYRSERRQAAEMLEAEESEFNMDFADDAWNQPEPTYAASTEAKAEKDHSFAGVASSKQQARLIVELPATANLEAFDLFTQTIKQGERVVQCDGTDSCAALNQLLSNQAGWLPVRQIVQPNILITLRLLK